MLHDDLLAQVLGVTIEAVDLGPGGLVELLVLGNSLRAAHAGPRTHAHSHAAPGRSDTDGGQT